MPEHLRADGRKRRILQRSVRDEDQIVSSADPGKQWRDRLPEPSFDPVPDDRVPKLFADGKTDPCHAAAAPRVDEDHKASRDGTTDPVCITEFLFAFQRIRTLQDRFPPNKRAASLSLPQTLNLRYYALSVLRPCARLRRRTLRPSAVAMRLRKPCTLLRCLFLG